MSLCPEQRRTNEDRESTSRGLVAGASLRSIAVSIGRPASLVYRTSWRTRDEAENATFAYTDGWNNTRRIQRELGYLSPDEYETAWHTHQTQPAKPPIATPAPTGSR